MKEGENDRTTWQRARHEILDPFYQNLLRNDRMASLGKLSVGVAHEIVNPLSAILNFALLMQHLVSDEGIPSGRLEDFRQYLSRIADEASRASRFVAGYLDYSRGGSKASAKGVELNRVVERTALLLAPLSRPENVEFELVLQGDLPVIGFDALQMQQVVLNLVLNAVDAVKARGKGKVTIRTFLSEGGGAEVLEVRDDGEGIRPEIISKVFDPFFTTRKGDSAVGLGLTLVRAILESRGGSIQVESEAGKGTRVRVILPVDQDTSHPALTNILETQ